MSKYLEFNIMEIKPKTKVFTVSSKGIILGTVKWFAQWRQYAFFPYDNTLFNTECLNDIINFIKEQTELRK